MPGRQSFLCANPASPLARVRRLGFYSQCKKLLLAGLHSNRSMLLRKDGSVSAVALGVCHDSLTHRGWLRRIEQPDHAPGC